MIISTGAFSGNLSIVNQSAPVSRKLVKRNAIRVSRLYLRNQRVAFRRRPYSIEADGINGSVVTPMLDFVVQPASEFFIDNVLKHTQPLFANE